MRLRSLWSVGLLGGLAAFGATNAQAAACARTLTADVVVIDQPIINNRLGASNVNGMMYALKQDVLDLNAPVVNGVKQLPRLRDDKRPRPLVLRVAAGDCLTINFENHLAPVANPRNAPVDADGIGNDPNEAINAALDPTQSPQIPVFVDEQVAGRFAGFHAAGMQLVGTIASDGSNVGRNASSLVAPGGRITYQLYAEKEGVYQVVSHGALFGSDANQGNVANGLFGQVIVEPKLARTYRNTVTEEEMRLATRTANNALVKTPGGHPVLDYDAVYPNVAPWNQEGKAGMPILNMVCTEAVLAKGGTCTLNKIIHTEVDAVVAGPNADGTFPADTYPLEKAGRRNPAYANRLQPFRDFAQVWHDEVANAQAFPGFYSPGFIPPADNCPTLDANGNPAPQPGDCPKGGAAARDPLTPVFAYLLKGVRDKFMINYGSGGIGTEILANRLGVGPMHDCLNCAYEEFFLTHFTVGEVGQLVDIPANQGLETITPQNVLNILLSIKQGGTIAQILARLTPLEQSYFAALGPKAQKPLYPGDPANINHSYVGDFVKFRNTHNGFEQHVFHLHNHQWLFNPNDDNANYLDAQGIGPGMGYTYEIANGGSGNRNKSAGDAIYHCHFYPHFAQGMWYMWRIHDVFESGTKLQVSGNGFHANPYGLKDGTPAANARALPDGELLAGTPIPAVVPLPGKPLAPIPSANVWVTAVDRDNNGKPESSQAVIDKSKLAFDGKWNPGYPFWIAGIACESETSCEQGTVGQRPSTPPMDMMVKGNATTPGTAAYVAANVEPFKSEIAAGRLSAADFTGLAGTYGYMHGGLPRHALHGVAAGGKAGPTIAGIVSPVDLTKFVEKAKPVFLPEEGTDVERAAMAAHSVREHGSQTYSFDGNVASANFVLNGMPPVPGAPYSDPCVDDAGKAVTRNGSNQFFSGTPSSGNFLSLATGPFGAYTPRVYRGANIQYDAVLNKVGYHYPQQRIVSLWEDAVPVISKNKPGEPLVMRLNTFDCAMYHHTNLVPETFEMDDYQLRTPTDIIGQHIHLPKWDLTTTDGAANGWNYEDGTLAAGAVRERIHAINEFNLERQCEAVPEPEILPEQTVGVKTVTATHKCPPGTAKAGQSVTVTDLVAQPHPYFGQFAGNAELKGVNWDGARITLQRWFADPLLNTQGVDRGLGIIFTHDHYGPSTFQQIGLYSTVLIEPARSQWKHNEDGYALGCTTAANDNIGEANTQLAPKLTACRYDGGPTSWQATIDTALSGPNGDIDRDGKNDSFREFYFEYTDFQHAYEAGVYVGAGTRGEYNGPFDEAAYVAPLGLVDLFYPHLADDKAPAKFSFPGGLDTFRFAIAPPLITPVFPIFPDLTVEKAVTPATGALAPLFGGAVQVPQCVQRPCPTSIDFLEPGMFVVNYRNEPVSLRIFDPTKPGPDAAPGKDCSLANPDRTGCGMQADGIAGDLAFALATNGPDGNQIVRKIAALNTMPAKGDVAQQAPQADRLPATNRPLEGTKFPPHINSAGFFPGDPFTPILRTYSGDRVRIKAQAGGDEEEHSWSIHGIKWTQGGSGHGQAPHSGWRNQQAGGISEQMTAAAPVFMDFTQTTTNGTADYLYMMDAHQDGFWTGNWGILRNYNVLQTTLTALPNNVRPVQPLNRIAFQNGDRGVCPRLGPDFRPTRNVTINISAVLANDVLGNPFAVKIPAPGEDAKNPLFGPDTGMLSAGTPDVARPNLPARTVSQLHVGGPLDPNGGTLVYNKRGTPVLGFAQGVSVEEAGALNDPTAMMYVLDEDLDLTGVTPKLKATAPQEPLALRVNAGDCVTVNLTNRLPAEAVRLAPDLPNYNDLRHAVKRERFKQALDPVTNVLRDEGSTTFSNNLARPSSNVGFHTQLLEYDVTRSDGTNVGINPTQTAAPGQRKTYTFYAGDLRLAELPQIGDVNRFNLDVVLNQHVEFGGANVLPADRVKQPQKGLFGEIIVEPFGSTVEYPYLNDPDRPTRAVAAVVAPARDGLPAQTYRDMSLVWQKMMNYRYASGNAVQNESEEGPGLPENPPHTILNGANYRAEPTFFRFGISPLFAAGGAGCAEGVAAPAGANPNQLPVTCFGAIPNPEQLFDNDLVGADPETPIFRALRGKPFRIHLVHPNSSNRGTTFTLHGHVWPRDPYLARDRDAAGFPRQLAGQRLGGVASIRIGDNPMQMYFGAQESIIGSSHYSFVMPSAGGVDAVTGDYLFRDTAAAGFGGGAWGILRVE